MYHVTTYKLYVMCFIMQMMYRIFDHTGAVPCSRQREVCSAEGDVTDLQAAVTRMDKCSNCGLHRHVGTCPCH